MSSTPRNVRVPTVQAPTVQSPRVLPANDVYGLEIFGFAKSHWMMYIMNEKYDNHENRKTGYSLGFEEQNGKKMLTCNDLSGREVWKTEINNQKTLSQCAIDHFKNLLATHHTKLKKLVVCGRFFENINFGIRSLESLEDLEIDGNADIQQFFFPNSERPLRKLRIRGTDDVVALRNYEEIYVVKEVLDAPALKLNNEQFLRLKAPNVHISIQSLTPENIADFIKTWQKSYNSQVYGDYQWAVANSNFDLERLFTLLDVYDRYVFERKTMIDNDMDGLAAELFYAENVLRFKWNYNET